MTFRQAMVFALVVAFAFVGVAHTAGMIIDANYRAAVYSAAKRLIGAKQ